MGWHTDVFSTIPFLSLAFVCTICFAPRRHRQVMVKQTQEGKRGERRRFPPYITSKEIKRIRLLAHATRCVNKVLIDIRYDPEDLKDMDKKEIEEMKRFDLGETLDQTVQEPYDREEDLRGLLNSLHVCGEPIHIKKHEVLCVIISARVKGRRLYIIAFRGTKGMKNVKADLRASQVNFQEPCKTEWFQDMEDDMKPGEGYGESDPVPWRFGGPKEAFVASEASETDASDTVDIDFGTQDVEQPEEDEEKSKNKKKDKKKKKKASIRVHNGFNRAFKSAEFRIMKELKHLVSKHVKGGRMVDVWCAGHSFGGALATMLSVSVTALLKYVDPKGEKTSAGLYTVGSPRLGNGKFAACWDAMDLASVRLVMEGDPIPNVPPAFMGYKHVGTLLWLTREGHLRKDPTFLEIGLRGHLSILMLPYVLYNFTDNAVNHKIASYVIALADTYDREIAGADLEEQEEEQQIEKYIESTWALDEILDGHMEGEIINLDIAGEFVYLANRALVEIDEKAVLLKEVEDESDSEVK